MLITILLLQLSMIITIGKLSKQPIKNYKILIICSIIFSLIYTFNSFHISSGLNTLIYIIYLIILCKKLFQLTKKDLMFYIIFVYIIGILVDIILMLFINVTGIVNILNAKNEFIYRFLSTLMMLVFYIVICNNKKMIKIIQKFKNTVTKIKISYYEFIILMLIYFLLGLICINKIKETNVITFILFLSISVFLFSIYFINQNFKMITMKESMKILNKNNEFYIELIDQFRIIKHNLIGNLLSLKTVANRKEQEIIDDLIEKYSSMVKTPVEIKSLPPGLDGLIQAKLCNITIQNFNVLINNKIKSKIMDVISPHAYNELYETLNVVIDNAIEASEESNDKILKIDFIEKNDFLQLTITNSFSGMIDLEKLGEKNYTSKTHGHGLGIFSIFKKEEMKITNHIRNNMYQTIIKISKKNEE